MSVETLRLALYHWDDIVVFLVITPLFYSFVSFFLLPPKREPGYELFYSKPQEALGLLNAQKTDEVSRDISVRLNKTVCWLLLFLGCLYRDLVLSYK